MSKLRSYLQRERATRGWSLTDLAEKSGIPLSTLSRYESAKYHGKPSHENVLLLARAFGTGPGTVLRFIGYPRQEYANETEREQEWARIRGLIESDPRAKKILESYESAAEEDKDRGAELIDVFFKNRPRPRVPRRSDT